MLKFEIFRQDKVWKIHILDADQNYEWTSSFSDEPTTEELLTFVKVASKIKNYGIFVDFTDR